VKENGMSSDTKTDERGSSPLKGKFRQEWQLMSLYERFEHSVVLALGAIIAVVIIIALVQLYLGVLPLIARGALDPLDHSAFQSLFGSIFTVLIALEFKHSIIRATLRKDSIVQVQTVLLIALLAISRKFVILDLMSTSPETIASLAAVTLVLGIVYWLLADRRC
jgi:uncharacterized membrane protein (DUF373 family)